MEVTPRVGVWIETVLNQMVNILGTVTPRVGVWIETYTYFPLKTRYVVTPRVGVWIETVSDQPNQGHPGGHSPRGSVD